MPIPVKGLLEVYEEMVEVLLVLKMFLTEDYTRANIHTEIKVNGQKIETVTNFEYLGSVITDEGSKPEILSRIAQTIAPLTRLKSVWNDRSISLSSKIRPMSSLVTAIFLCL